MGKVLLIGNDINNATSDYSWRDLIDGLITFSKIREKPDMANKPFPMLYEEIYLTAARQNGLKELEIKSFIASNTGYLEPNAIHEHVVSLEVENILTTNYDLTCEKCLSKNSGNLTNQGFIKETLYSLFRMHHLERKKIWHIHGSELLPRSITLGYEHYSGYLQQMRNYIASGAKGIYKNKDFSPIEQRLQSGPFNHYSWVDYFFTHDVHILGLNLDFVEMHLWWLLTYRARLLVEERISLTNKIYYYFPEQLMNSSRPKLQLFHVNGVETISFPIRRNDKMQYYKEILDHIEKTK
jgi:hypothetical protein